MAAALPSQPTQNAILDQAIKDSSFWWHGTQGHNIYKCNSSNCLNFNIFVFQGNNSSWKPGEKEQKNWRIILSLNNYSLFYSPGVFSCPLSLINGKKLVQRCSNSTLFNY